MDDTKSVTICEKYNLKGLSIYFFIVIDVTTDIETKEGTRDTGVWVDGLPININL